jgi:DNA helicase II / ATP-dependent DNA helicase PcrA
MRPTQLSDEQLAAVTARGKAMVLTAGAGSGKTEVVAQRVERLLTESVQSGTKVLAITYTVKAADELRKRFAATLGDLKDRADVNTIHGFCLDSLKNHGHLLGWSRNPDVLSRNEDRQSLFATWLRETGQKVPDDLRMLFQNMDLSRAKRQNLVGDDVSLPNWKHAMETYDSIDFPEMLDRAINIFNDPWMISFTHRIYSDVIIDEAQNLTEAQYEFITALIGEPASQRLSTMFVGDQRQSIVSFAGADPSIIDRFANDYTAQRFELTVNFRSASLILALGRRVAMKMNLPVVPNDESTVVAPGKVELVSFDNETAEGNEIAEMIVNRIQNGLDPFICGIGEDTSLLPEQIGVLSRSAASLRSVKDALEVREIQISIASTEDEWVSSLVAKCVMATIAIRAEPDHQSRQRQLERLLGQEKSAPRSNFEDLFKASPDPSIQQLENLALFASPGELSNFLDELLVDDASWAEDLKLMQSAILSFESHSNSEDATFSDLHSHLMRVIRGDSQGPGVRLLTIHKSQGQEFRLVFVIGMNEGQFPDFRATSLEQQREELRTFYVAVSRPSRELVLSRSKLRATKYRPRVTEVSPFLAFAELLSD